MTWHATLSLDYTLESERSVLRHVHEGPLRVLKSLYPQGEGTCHNVLVHPPGGLVGVTPGTFRWRLALARRRSSRRRARPGFTAHPASLRCSKAGCAWRRARAWNGCRMPSSPSSAGVFASTSSCRASGWSVASFFCDGQRPGARPSREGARQCAAGFARARAPIRCRRDLSQPSRGGAAGAGAASRDGDEFAQKNLGSLAPGVVGSSSRAAQNLDHVNAQTAINALEPASPAPKMPSLQAGAGQSQ